MADGKKSFLFYNDWSEIFKELPPEKGYALLMHILAYVNDENPNTEDDYIKLAFASIKNTLKRDLDKWEARAERSRENGKNGGRPPKSKNPEKPNGLNRNPENPDEPEKPVIVSVSVRDSVVINNKRFLEDLKKNETEHASWAEGLHMKHSLKKGSLNSLLKQFIWHLDNIEKPHPDLKSFKSHFDHWLGTCGKSGTLNEYKHSNVGML
ncbi:hypothetical protein D2V93_08505 [Flagellimonas taeanensis]|uniref:DUF6291 domain-containing protein n=1 Tax=Flagellimonas taeanensis TaxID=1005926 RepID=UPI000E69CE83|nr:DUF6291 domain-containing protein [Allomuricauda taeanensis]RIV50902.1 hypothetical protein D2V93_08505 [Allomuricauda taeanensis]